MSYDLIENSVDLGSPVTLFEFIYGQTQGDAFRYSTTNEPVTLAGRAWSPQNLKHSEISSSGTLDKAGVTVTARSDIEVAKLFLAAPPSQQVVLSIWRGHALTLQDGWDDFQRIWIGRVLSAEWGEADVEFKCEPVATSAKRVGLRRFYQYGCNHVLYGRACGVSELAYTAECNVIQVINNRTPVVSLHNYPAEVTVPRLVGGIMKLLLPDGRTVMRSVVAAKSVYGGVQLSLMSAIPELSVGMYGTVARGCKHTFEDCKTFFNTVNYGGCPNIPKVDAFRTNTF